MPGAWVIMKLDLRWAIAGLALFAAACDKKAADNAAAPAGPSTPVAGVAPPAGQQWTDVVSATPDGGIRMGNPNAPVKLLEWGSLTCPHCAEFSKEATGGLRDMVKSGKVSWEFRNFLLNPIDVPVSVLARCQGPGPFFKLVEDVYTEQPNWIKAFQNIPDAEQKRIQALTDQDRVKALADIGKLPDFFRARGLPTAKAEACLTDKGQTDQLIKMRQQAIDMGVDGTPSFFINGAKADGVYSWETAKKALNAALGGG
jgi:protein-disulfide isomerase